MKKRIDQAITDFTSGRACMHVPPFDTDVDIVLSECLKMQAALQLCVASLDQLLPHLAKVPADVGLLNSALMAARPFCED